MFTCLQVLTNYFSNKIRTFVGVTAFRHYKIYSALWHSSILIPLRFVRYLIIVKLEIKITDVSNLTIREAVESDNDQIHQLIMDLAEFEKIKDTVEADKDSTYAALFGNDPSASAH